MSARDELVDILMADDLVFSDKHIGRDYALEEADAILAAGYRKPRTITTAEELDALPRLAVIRSDEGAVFEKHTMWHEAGSRDLMRTDGIALPATVIYEPEPQP
ncbi:MAG: hypothetical protein M3536_12615 [Actinomycetota bacterium]|nr:hypothetical protein [Actinomycetota bacterium]